MSSKVRKSTVSQKSGKTNQSEKGNKKKQVKKQQSNVSKKSAIKKEIEKVQEIEHILDKKQSFENGLKDSQNQSQNEQIGVKSSLIDNKQDQGDQLKADKIMQPDDGQENNQRNVFYPLEEQDKDDELNFSPDPPQDLNLEQELESLKGSIEAKTIGEETSVMDDLTGREKAKSHQRQSLQGDTNELDMNLIRQNDADQYTNFDRDQEKIDGGEPARTRLSLNEYNELNDDKDHDLNDKVDPNEPSDDFADISDLDNLNEPAQETIYNDDDIYNAQLHNNEQEDLESIRALTARNELQTRVADAVADYERQRTEDLEKKRKGQPQMNIDDELAYEEEIRQEYLLKFRKEVDFHHKVAYRYEKAYRLVKKQPHKKQALNLEIIDIISEHSDYIEQDPMSLFYCLYFCIYYNNPDLIEFLRTLIQKMDTANKPPKVEQILEYIDVNGLQRLRTTGEVINSHVYHMVYYQAVDDELRVVYSQILRQLRLIQMRDKDALILLKNRDYDLIRLTFDKFTTKIKITLFFKKGFAIKSHAYRQYNQAYYEEILIDNKVEARIAKNYRDRFLKTSEEINMVLQMYSKNDYVNHFLKLNLDQISHQRFVELFCIAIKNDAFKIAMQLYLRYITTFDIDTKIMDILIESFKTSLRFHEYKLFFLHEHFDLLTIFQMNYLIDTFMEILHRPQHKLNPILSQYNTIKYALLIYRISWKIEQKRIYSLITKCTLLNNYIDNGLNRYFEIQQHISQLYCYMREPIFHMSERKDSLDIMLEMKMENLLQHPVIVEVLNLVYEGKYSVDSSAMSLSQTFASFFQMETNELKSINERLIQNISAFGDSSSGKQASLQFNIWKQCIQQREQDDMLFTVIVSLIVVTAAFYIDQVVSVIIADTMDTFDDNFIRTRSILTTATEAELTRFCPLGMENLLKLSSAVSILSTIVIISGIGYVTAVIQRLILHKLKDNVHLSVGHLILEMFIVVASGFYMTMLFQNPSNQELSDACKGYSNYGSSSISQINYAYALLSPKEGEIKFRILLSVFVILYSLIMILMLQRTQGLGELIMMVDQMSYELLNFLITFGVVIVGFIIMGRQLNEILKVEQSSFLVVILDIFDGFNGNTDYTKFTTPEGKIFITIFMYIFNVCLLSFLVAMFINRYKYVYKNLAALRRMNIIKLKNSSSYDQYFGGVTITFFPISIIVLPFIIPIVVFKSERLNEFILKLQYALMILMYIVIALLMTIPIFPAMYLKCVLNATYIAINNKRESYRGQNIINLLFTIFINPFIIIASLVVDLLSLPGLLLKDERTFEFKYQASLEILDDQQKEIVLNTFAKIFYMNFDSEFGGKGMTVYESMQMHTKIFNIIENMHDLCCKGTKDSKQALSNVQDYNMTKILGRKSSIPDKSGLIKTSYIDFNSLYSVQMDIETFNYYDLVLRDYKSGKLNQENDRKNQQGDNGLNAGVSFLPDEAAPAGIQFIRKNANFMNNFFINIVARSFTTLEEQIQYTRDNQMKTQHEEVKHELDGVKDNWKKLVHKQVLDKFSHLESRYSDFRMSFIESRKESDIKQIKNSKSLKRQQSTNIELAKADTQTLPKQSDILDEAEPLSPAKTLGPNITVTNDQSDVGKLGKRDELDDIIEM